MTRRKQRFTFFWHSNSPFSQWHPSRFEVDGVAYSCAEQFMMHRKALLFADEETAARILDAGSARQQKALGRQVRGFDEDVWTRHREEIVLIGTRAKFSQNEALRAALLATAGTTLVEASPTDRIWGIGLEADDPRAVDPERWRGLNLLGKALTRVRDEMLGIESTPE